jgi:hypothetical protein
MAVARRHCRRSPPTSVPPSYALPDSALDPSLARPHVHSLLILPLALSQRGPIPTWANLGASNGYTGGSP